MRWLIAVNHYTRIKRLELCIKGVRYMVISKTYRPLMSSIRVSTPKAAHLFQVLCIKCNTPRKTKRPIYVNKTMSVKLSFMAQ